jgi:hypothetical protein
MPFGGVGKCVAPIRALLVPNECSTVSRGGADSLSDLQPRAEPAAHRHQDRYRRGYRH